MREREREREGEGEREKERERDVDRAGEERAGCKLLLNRKNPHPPFTVDYLKGRPCDLKL